MSNTWTKTAGISAVGVMCSLAVWISATNAKDETSVLVKKQPVADEPQGPVIPPPSNPNAKGAPAASPSTSGDLFAPPATAAPNNAAKSLPAPPQAAQPSPGVKQPFIRPAVPRGPAKGSLVVGEETMPPPPSPGPVVTGPAAPVVATEGLVISPTPPIDYDTDHDARKMYRTGKIDLVMLTTDPTSNCTYEIPMCIPACCVGDPKVSTGRGIFGRGIVEYRWACGFRAIVKFRHVLKDVEVEYEGD